MVDSLRPVTIAQLLKATPGIADGEWKINNVQIGKVRPFLLFF